MTQFIDRASIALLSDLVTSAGRSLILAGVTAAGLAVFRARGTSLRLFLWASVLYASLSLPLLAWLLPPLPVPVPESWQRRIAQTELKDAGGSLTLASAVRSPATGEVRDSGVAASSPRALESHAIATTPPAPGATPLSVSSSSFTVHWEQVAASIYLFVTIVFLIRFGAGIVLSRKLVRNSRPITEPSATVRLACSTLSPSPRLAMSDWISVPLTVGALQPTILLPADWHAWDEAKLKAILVHELSHVARGDALTQRMALLYRAIFWFNPLAWWLNRHLAALAEQASDEAALSGGADQRQYARTLLGFFEALQAAPGRVRWQGVSMARPGQAEERLERILAWKGGTVTMHLKRSIAVAILVLAIPVIYLAASVRASDAASGSANSMAQEPARPAPAQAPVVGVTGAAPVGGVSGAGPATGVQTAAPEVPIMLAAPPPAEYGQHHESFTGHRGYAYAYGFDDDERFVMVSGKTDSYTMSGSTQDIRHVEKLKKQIGGDFIWFQRDEKSYIIRDKAAIDRARSFWAPGEELGKKQEELGKQQEALGKQQEALSAKMEQVRVNIPDMTEELDRLKAKLQKLGPTATVEQIGDLQAEIGELQSKIGEIQSQAGEQQSRFGAEQGALGAKQGALGEQQGELGRQQGELAKRAARQMKELLDEAIKNGTAKPEEEIVKSPTL